MKRSFLLLYSMLLCIMVSCSGPGNPHAMIKASEKSDTCKLDPQNTYEVYIPGRIDAADKLPMLVIIDAHGSGQFALGKFRHGANQYPAILVASNLVKNGFGNYEKAIQTLIGDVRQKYPVGELVFMTGFSGGARMALGYAVNHRIDGLILCGALANADQVNAARCPIISISGTDDFNFMETAQYLFQGQSIPGNLKIELTDASHNWPDSLLLANAFGFLYLSSPAAGVPSPARTQLKMFERDQKARIDTLVQQGDLLKAALVARNMSSTVPFNSDKIFASNYNDLKADPQYLSQLNRLEKCLRFEISARQPYIDAFTTKDSLWWKNEIKTINAKIRSEPDPFINDMYRRIKGFLGIACYSLGNQAIKEQNAEKMNGIVSIYFLVEPENPYVSYFSAFPYYWNGNMRKTVSHLKKAMEAGFSDMDQLNNDFPVSITSQLF